MVWGHTLVDICHTVPSENDTNGIQTNKCFGARRKKKQVVFVW